MSSTRRSVALLGATGSIGVQTLDVLRQEPDRFELVALSGGEQLSELAAMVADMAPADLRGTGFGVVNLVQGLVALLASLLAGLLWERFGAPATFMGGAGFSLLAIAALARQKA